MRASCGRRHFGNSCLVQTGTGEANVVFTVYPLTPPPAIKKKGFDWKLIIRPSNKRWDREGGFECSFKFVKTSTKNFLSLHAISLTKFFFSLSRLIFFPSDLHESLSALVQHEIATK